MGGMMNDTIKEIIGICDKCIFGQSYTSDGKLTRVCEGSYPLTTEEAHQRIIKAMESGVCETYEEGHARWLEMKESGLGLCSYYVNTPAEEKYKINKTHADKPVYACSSGSQCCLHGNIDIGCYWKVSGCTSQMRLDDPTRMAEPSILKDAFEKAGIDTSDIDYLK